MKNKTRIDERKYSFKENFLENRNIFFNGEISSNSLGAAVII